MNGPDYLLEKNSHRKQNMTSQVRLVFVAKMLSWSIKGPIRLVFVAEMLPWSIKGPIRLVFVAKMLPWSIK